MKTLNKESTVGLKELREHMGRYIRAVEKGNSLTVIRRSKPVFRIAPVEEDEILWEKVIDFTKIKKGGVHIDEVLARL